MSKALFVIFFITLTGCAGPSPGVRPAVYDFGPLSPTAAPRPAQPANQPPLLISEIEAAPALDSTAVLYRLAYADPQQLKAYALARWSMTPAQLLRQRLRERLAEHRTVLNPGDAGTVSPAPAPTPAQNRQAPATLRLELEEFSQLFETPAQSVGLLRLRATLVQTGPGGEKWLAQRSFRVQRPAASADAGGGVRALTAATETALQEIDDWLLGLAP